ncbi:MAG: hypothetical protein ABWY16_04855 [Pedobacter sp.]|uniref:hypothetical protein n=1 Tax=Pedobacter sp. TaxID=1411316 RepID=UPI00339B4D6C
MNLAQQNTPEKRMSDHDRYFPILQLLADGVNPVSGDVFPAGSIYQQPEIIRALFYAVNEVRSGVGNTKRGGNQGKPWSPEEEELLIQQFHEEMKISEIARVHERTTGSIRARLVKLELLAQ